jgi:hypothetical protein
VLVAVAGVLVVGCSLPFGMRDQTVYVAPARIAAAPPAIRVFDFDAGGDVTTLPEEASAVRVRLEPAINRAISARGGRFFSLEAIKGLEGGEAFLRWCFRALHEIEQASLTKAQGRWTPYNSVTEWTYPYDLAPLQKSLDADFLLVSLFFDGRHTAGRNVVNVLSSGVGGTSRHAKRTALACVVELGDGRVVWCDRMPLQGVVNLADDSAARQVVDQLLRGLYSMSSEEAAQARLVRPPQTRPAPVAKPPAPPIPSASAQQPGVSDD